MRTASNIWAVISLIVANTVPLYGTFALGWNVFSIMLIYWFESAIIGYFTLLKMRKVDQPFNKSFGVANSINNLPTFFKSLIKGFLPNFFAMHYGIFMTVHFALLFGFFYSPEVSFLAIATSCASLIMSHFVSYQTNFINNKEYKRLSQDQLFFSPYPRVIAMHMTIILGAFFVLNTGRSQIALAILVAIKTVVDLLTHLLQHRRRGDFLPDKG